MREIKFRAWYGEIMLFRELCDRNWYSNSTKHAKLIRGAMPNDLRAMKIMQFTGIRDKNGKEIYEGDIIDRGHNLQPFVVGDIRIDTRRLALMIKFSRENKDAVKVRVIGNIHENPDLIK